MCPVKVCIHSDHIMMSGANNDWTLEIQDEQRNMVIATFPNLCESIILLDGEPVLSCDTVERVFTLSPYNYYDCALWRMGTELIVDTITVKNRLIDDDVVHQISIVRK